ncbi:MAG: carboxylate--amine ligase [Bacillota bacterium]|nr:carboxylate--amine ligase [Bacillota bacterium]
MQIPVIMLGANFYTSLGAIRTLGRRGVPVHAFDYDFSTAYALSSKYVTRKVLCPDINSNEKELVDFLINYSNQFTLRPVLMSTADNYALMVSRHSDKLAKHYRFPIMEPGLLEKIIDKNGLYELAIKHDLSIPKTYIVNQYSNLNQIALEMPYPCIIKPALSHKFVKVFRQKCLFANNKEDLLSALETARKSSLEVMVQEIIPGFDDQMYVYDTYINKYGNATHTFSGQKLRQFPINFGSSTLTHQLYDQELIELGQMYMKRINYRGYGEIEFKKDFRTGEFKLIEINARLSTLNILFDKCGVEFTYAMYRDLIDDPLPDFHLAENKPWAFWHAYEDLISNIAYLKTKQLTLWQIIKPWASHYKAHAILATDDWKPLFSFAWLITRKGLNKIKRLITRQERGAN